MIIEIDFNSDEALYLQLRNQIILGIATSRFHEGDSLPSVRQLAESIGINMHTVNKAYAILREDGFLTFDRRRGAMIVIDCDKNITVFITNNIIDTINIGIEPIIYKSPSKFINVLFFLTAEINSPVYLIIHCI